MDVFKDGQLNAEWIKQLDQKDPLVSKIRAYYLAGTKVKPEFKCGATKCQLPVKSAEYLHPASANYEYNPMIFCFTCNRVFHIYCVGISRDNLSEEAVPWLCTTCRENLMNAHATNFYKATKYSDSIRSRRKYFLRDTTIESKEAEFDTDQEYDSSDVDSFKRFEKLKQPAVDDTVRLQNDIIKARNNEKRATERSNALEREISELKAKETERQRQMEQMQKQIASLLASKTLESRDSIGAHSSNVSFNMSQFYSQGAEVPAGESTRRNLNATTIPGRTNPRVEINDSTMEADNANDTTLVDVLSRFTTVQEETRNDKRLASIRKAMPKIAEFNGDPMKWLEFEQDVNRYKTECQYDDKEIKLYMRGSLKGDAFEAIKDFINLYPLEDLMQILRESFGDPMILVRRKNKDIRALKIPNYLYREDAVRIRVCLQSYFAACTYAKTGHLNSNELAESIYEQFNNEDKARCKELFIRKNPNKQVVVCLKTIYDYLSERLPILDEKPDQKHDKGIKKDEKSRPAQVMTTGASISTNNRNLKQDFKFEVRDKSTAPYMGYDMSRVNAIDKKCEICNRANHFTVQCSQFQAMDEDQRLKTVNDKKLCRNCIMSTGHRASECNLKVSCGLKFGQNGRCSKRHHISIHYACNKSQGSFDSRPNRRFNNRRNTNNSQQSLGNATSNRNIPQQAAQQNEPQQPAQAANQVQQIQQRAVQNAQQANIAQVNASTNASGSFHVQPPRQYSLVPNSSANLAGVIQINHLTLEEVPKTIKMFRNKFSGPNGHIIAYSIGDSAAEVTLVRDDLRVELGITGKPHQLSLQWTDGTIKDCMAIKFDMEVQGVLEHSEKLILKDCYSIADLDLPARSLDMEIMKRNFPYLRDVKFDSYLNEQPVMLIGSPHAFAIESIKGLIEGGVGYPVALEAKLGVTVYGGNPFEALPSLVNMNVMAKATGDKYQVRDESNESDNVSNEELHDLLTYFNSVESLGIRAKDSILTEAEQNAIAILREEMKVLPNGTIEVPLVWNRRNNIIPSLPNNFPVAYRRLLSQEARLTKNPGYYEAYVNKVKELIDLKYLRDANENDMNGSWNNIWYLPLSLVVNANKDPPKFRIVYDASSKYEGVSLNDKLLKGPDLLIDLVKPLLRMRMNQIAFTADVQQMFHRVKICLRDQQCQRILFRENPNHPVKTMILDVMAFGPTCSPFVSQFVKNWNAENWSRKYPEAAKTIISQMYMDDIITSEPTVDIAISRALECIEICKHINWSLISFQSNSLEFLKGLPGDNIKQELMPILANEAEGFTTKVLGCNWDTVSDSFVFQLDRNIFIKLVTEFNHHPTKRDQASTIARIYDVLGLISPFLIRGKMLLQRSWKLKINWDDTIPEDMQIEWKKWLAEIENVAKLRITRRYCSSSSIKEANKVQLHVFCDAGVEAYGCVAYIVTHFDNRVESNIVMAKAKVTPLRLQTKTEIKEIPRLELYAALLAARLGDTITKVMDDIQFERFYWSDSEVVLRWILNPNQRLLKYAITPIEDILELTKRDNWRYVPTNLNPADLVTKFKKIEFSDSKSEWFVGPDFLRNSLESWPQIPHKLMVDETFIASNIYLEKLKYSTHELPPVNCPIADDSFIDRLSPAIRARWLKLKKAVARALKLYMDVFLPLIKNKQFNNIAVRMELKRQHNGFNYLTSADLERAEHFIFRKMQRETYSEEYQQIVNGKSIRNKEFSQLSVFIDRQGLLRINSRANLNSTNFPQQFVPVLPRKNVLIHVLLMYYHEKFKHIAIEAQIAELRTRCWIPQIRHSMRTVKGHCNYCRLIEAQAYDPMMAPLPEDRVNPELQPFEVTGVDLMGPISVVCYGRVKKIYVMIFTCTLTRFVHLHIIDSLESLRVLEAIVIFWGAHGPVRKFVSDNGTNFVGAAKILKEDYQNTKLFLEQQQSILGPKLSEELSVDWEFIPPGSPWFGGFYERLIKEVKRSIADTLKDRKVTRVELSIAVAEASHRLNLRPLTHNSIDAEDDCLLTPHHLAKHRPGWPLLPGMHNGKYIHVDDRTIYRKGRVLADEIMRKFTAYYLPVLTRKIKWLKEKDPLAVDDLVLMIEPNKTRKEWPRGKVVKLFYGKDDVPRVADVRKANGKIKRRPIRKLAKIDIKEPPKTL